MNELVNINWTAVAAGLLWITGFGLGIVGISLALVRGNGKTTAERKRFAKKLYIAGAVLIAYGGLLSLFDLPSHNLLVTKVEKIRPSECLEVGDGLEFTVEELHLDPLNRKYKQNRSEIKDNTAALFNGGSIKTPCIRFEPGFHVIGFDARGTFALDEYAILKVELSIPDENGYLQAVTSQYIHLTEKMRPYAVTANIPAGAAGRVKISFVNDDFVLKGKKDRNAWVKDISIRKGSQ